MPLSCMLFLVGLSISLPVVLQLALLYKSPVLSLLVGALGVASMCGAFGAFYTQFPELWRGWPNLMVVGLGIAAIAAFIAICVMVVTAVDEMTKGEVQEG